MGTGFLKVSATTAMSALPVASAKVTVSQNGNTLYDLVTNENGDTEIVQITAPDKEASLDPGYQGIPYSKCDVAVSANGFIKKIFHGVEVFDGETSILPVNMTNDAVYDYIDDPDNYGHVDTNEDHEEIFLPEHDLKRMEERRPEYQDVVPAVLQSVVIPLTITVHLGTPASNASNVTVPFRDYIKNVASHEIYPTWPEAALEANILCQISLVLNRVYTEWYRSRGFYFDITNSTQYDQYFVYQGTIFANISALVDRIFNRFIQREGHKEPFFAEYCNGTTATCPGLSQWGSEELAMRGYDPLQILKYYYPQDIQIIESNNMQEVQESYPGYPLTRGSTGSSVRVMQDYLNRIRINYPLIPQINPPDGVFGEQTENAVKTFQGIGSTNLTVTGVIDRATWFRIVYFYTSVKKLAELTSEGRIVGVGRVPPTQTIGTGSRGREVGILQYLLNFISDFYPEVPSVIQDFNFGQDTANSVRAFQKAFGLTQDALVGRTTWGELYKVYWDINDNVQIPEEPPEGDGNIPPFTGTLKLGSSGAAVRQVQTCLNNIATRYPTIPKLTVDGQFGLNTHNSVIVFQGIFGLAQDGIIGPVTWNKIFTECAKISNGIVVPPFPGTTLRYGSSGSSVLQVQTCLNNLTTRYPSIPKLVADGHFGNNTRNAVLEFQRIFGLTQDGIIGPLTWNRIFTECANVSGGGTIPPFPGTALRVGSTGFTVTQIQTCLNNISARYPSIPRVTVDGVFGNNTRSAVIEFQRIYEITQDGVVGPVTWNRIMTACMSPSAAQSADDRTVYVSNFPASSANTNAADILKFMLLSRMIKR